MGLPKKSQCAKGHLLSGENLYVSPKGAWNCKKCMRLNHDRYRQSKKGSEASKTRDLRVVFWTLEQFNFALVSQNNSCAICKTSFLKFPRSPFADHDHLEKKPRALLCSTCNSGLGMFKDNPALLEYAAEYLRKYGK